MIRVRPLCLLSLVCALVALDAAALPQQSQKPAQALDETVVVRLLEADVVVLDADGKPVHGLTKEDFVVLEDGTPQPITNFTEYRDTASTSLPGSQSPAPPSVSRPAPRTLAFLLDAMSLRGSARTDFFAEIRALVGRTVRYDDRVLILTWADGTFRPALDRTSDRRAINAAIDQVEKNPAVVAAAGPSITTREAELRAVAEASVRTVAGETVAMEPYDPNDLLVAKRLMADDELMQMQARTAAMQRIVSSFTGSPGRTVVVYASEHFPRIAGKGAFVGSRPGSAAPSFDEASFDTRRLIASVVAAANASGVAFYAVYPQIPSTSGAVLSIEEERMVRNRVLDAPAGEVGTDAMADQLILQNDVEALRQLTSETGGTLGVGPRGVRDVVDQIATDVGSYYSLGWRAQSDGTDRERRITVRTKNPALVVRTRTTLVEKSDRTRAEDLLVAQLYERGSAGELELDVDVKVPERPKKDRATIPIELTIPVDQLEFAGEEGARAAKFTVLTIGGARSGEATRVTRDTRSLPAGGKKTTDGVVRYTLALLTDLKSSVVSVGVFDENSGQVGIRTIVLTDGKATVSTPPPSSIANAAWREAFDRAVAQRKPLVVFFRPRRCNRCDELERRSLVHPAVAQRARNVAFAVVSWPPSGRPPAVWPSMQPGIGLFDPSGTLRAEWRVVPDTMALGRIFDGAIASSPNFQRAAALTRSGGPHAGAVEHAVGLLKLGFNGQARAVLEETAEKGNPLQRQRAMTALAPLDAREGRMAEAMATLAGLRAEPVSSEVAAEAAFAAGVLARHNGEHAEARDAFRSAIALAGADSPVGRAASAEMALVAGAIRIVPLSGEVISGLQLVRTVVSSPAIARVVFTLDGSDSTTVTAPPFSTSIQFGRLPVPHRVRVVGYDATGAEVGRDELAVNAAGNVFWVKLTDPPSGNASGEVAVSVELRAPAGHRVRSVALSWNDAPLATLASEPWRSVVRIPGEVGVLRATATLDDGRTAEDAVLLNGTGHTERMDVQLLQLPVTVIPPGAFTPADIVVKEGDTRRTVESVVPGSDAPLTVGLIIDSSSSMQLHLDEVQEAALRFLETALGPSDHAFLISFDSSARLVAAPTADRQRLRNALLTLLPNGYTALHDAIVLGLMQMEGIEGRRALLVFTDGDDTSSRYSAAEVAELSRRSNVPIYLIAPRLEGRSRDVVKAARASGGRSYEVSDVAKLGPIYDAIAEALRAQMLVTIRSAPAVRPNEWREITVEIAGRELDVRAPAGYYAPR